MSKKIGFKIYAIVLVFFAMFILISYGLYLQQVDEFNSENRSISVSKGDHAENGVSITIHERGMATDTWTKQFQGTAGLTQQTGLIYEAVLKNYTVYEISEWTLNIDVTGNYFINNGWCGTFEIHQMFNGEEHVQTLDLQNPGYVDLKHYYVDSDLVIPLAVGDRIVYHPSSTAKEDVIVGITPDLEAFNSVNIGFIVYYGGYSPIFNKAYVDYKFYKNPFAGADAKKYLAYAVAWVMLFVIYITLLISRKITSKRLEQSAMFIGSAMNVFTGFFEAKDSYTRGHSKRVAEYSARLAHECGVKDEKLQTVYHVAYMHDCGKCYIPDTILKKAGKLTDEEYTLMKSHTVKGSEMVQDFKAIDGLYDGVRYHHERYDGKGYPDGLKGEEIPWIARVICIADSYDAMSSDRCYREKLSPEAIRKEFERCRGTQFDPKLTDVFMKVLDDMAREKN